MATITFDLPKKAKDKPSLFLGVWGAKGGVGKTTLAINLAYSLAEKLKVGLLDADIDCPNVAEYLSIKEPLVGSSEENIIYPLIHNGVQVVSLGMITSDTLLWRGALLTQAIEQLIYKVKWKADIVIVDLPPGTSDIPLTLLSDIGLDGLILVTTPSKLSISDVEKSLKAANRLGIDVLGVVENMVGDIFPSKRDELEEKLPYLGSLPLSRDVAESTEHSALIYRDYDVFKDLNQRILEWYHAHNDKKR